MITSGKTSLVASRQVKAAPGGKFSHAQIIFEGIKPTGEMVKTVVVSAAVRFMDDDEFHPYRDCGTEVIDCMGGGHVELVGPKSVPSARSSKSPAFVHTQPPP